MFFRIICYCDSGRVIDHFIHIVPKILSKKPLYNSKINLRDGNGFGSVSFVLPGLEPALVRPLFTGPFMAAVTPCCRSGTYSSWPLLESAAATAAA